MTIVLYNIDLQKRAKRAPFTPKATLFEWIEAIWV